MKRTKIISLLFLFMITLPVLPILPFTGINSDYEIAPNDESLAPYSSTNAFSSPQQEFSLSTSSSSDVLPPEEEPITQPPPDYEQWIGGPRVVQSTWNISQTFTDCDNDTDYSVYIDKGMMYHDTSNFTRVGKIDTTKSNITVEDYNPLDGWYWYWQMDEKEDLGEVVFMAFNVTGQAPLLLSGFAIYLYSPTHPSNPPTGGNVEFTVFGAEYSSISGLGTQPDLSNQVAPWIPDYIDTIPRGEERWVSLSPGMMVVVLDPSMTYANTFYFAITMMPGAAIGWALMEDTGTPPDGDGEDEGDAWYSLTMPNLNFLDDDFFLAAVFNRHPYPSEVGMTVNSTAVVDLWPYPGTGFWDGGWHSPAINMTGVTRYYDVEFLFPAITYDVTWLGWFYENIYANTSFTAWVNNDYVDWNVSFFINYPSGAFDQRLFVSIEDDWTALDVLLDGIPHPDWSVVYSPSTGWWVQINNAQNGQWNVLCESSAYEIHAEVRDSANQIVTDLYALETAYVRGYVQDPGGENATDGNGILFVYGPKGNLQIGLINPLPMPPGGLVEIPWDIWTPPGIGGIYTLNVLWTNGTEAGLNVTTLGVWHTTQSLIIGEQYPEPGGELLRGERAEVTFFYHDLFGFGIDRATITVINETSGFEWEGYDFANHAGIGLPGLYTVYIFTDGINFGLHNVTIHIIQNYYDEQTYNKVFTIKSRTTHIEFLNGLVFDNSSGLWDWEPNPQPLINTSTSEFTILYKDDNGFPLAGAQLTPWLLKDENATRLDWIDLHFEDLGEAGLYNITIDTNPVEGNIFHEGNVGIIIIYAYKIGYEGVWSFDPGEPGLIGVLPQPRPTWIDVPLEYQHIELYEDWLYPTPQHPNILRVVLRDTLSGEDLSHGTVVLDVPGSGYVPLNLATPGLGLYEITALNTTGATPGTYDFTIRATATDFANSTTTVRITIYPKQVIVYDAVPDFRPAPNHGSSWSLRIQFRLGIVSPQFISTSEGEFISSFSKQQGLVYLPLGTKVTLEILQGAVSTQIEKFVEAEGWVYFEGILDQEGEANFYLYIDGDENYAGFTQEAIIWEGTPLRVMVQSFGSYFLSNPLFIIAAVCVIVIPLGSGLSYRRYVMLPKRRRKLAKYQAIADTFSDVANLNRLLVLHKESGICVFDPFAAESQDATLVAGFLQAISTFGHDLADSPGLANGKKEEATLRELTYEGFRILIHDGHFVRNALVLSGQPSDQLRNRLENFTTAFEKRYHKDFENWAGRVDQFNGASDLVEEIFLISLRHPHSVAKRKPRNVQLTSLESDIYKLSKELTLDREYVFLGQILSTYLTAAKTDKREALISIYQLRIKGVFVPIQLEPITPPDTSAA